MKGAVVFDQRWAFGERDLTDRLINGLKWKVRVNPFQRFPQTIDENNIRIVCFSVTLRPGTIKCDIRTVLDIVAEVLEPVEGGLFELIFGEPLLPTSLG